VNAAAGYRCDVLKVEALSGQDIDDWRALCARHIDYASPLLGPEFAQLAARRRNDVRCVLARKGGRLEAVLAVHMRPGGLARAIGSPFNDHAGPVFHPDATLSLGDLLSMARIASYRAQNVVDPYGRFGAEPGRHGVLSSMDSYYISLDGMTPDALLESLRAQNPKRHKEFRRKTHKIERDLGPPVLSWGTPVQEDLDLLFAWKSAQFRDERNIDIIHTRFSKQMLEETAVASIGDLQGFQIKLTVNGQMVAGHFGVRQGGTFHPWISAYDPKIAHYSPGILLLTLAIQSMNEIGLNIYSLSAGSEHYKKYFWTHSRQVLDVCMSGPSLAGRLRKLNRDAWWWAGGSQLMSWPARIGRSIEQIVMSESHVHAQLGVFANAVVRRVMLDTAKPDVRAKPEADA
jgi:CelD/BcsL family acetyltransferase involved in cellulose biosynthesis